MRSLRIAAATLAMPALVACAGLGDPIRPGQFAQACVNETLGGVPADPPTYVVASQAAVGEGYAALFVNGTVAVNPREAGARNRAHEATRQWGLANGRGANPGAAFFAVAERTCSAEQASARVDKSIYRKLGVM